MSSSPQPAPSQGPATDTRAEPLFRAVNGRGDEVSLRLPVAGEMLCDPCTQAVLAGSCVPAGHRCQDAFALPLWIVRADGCPLTGFTDHVAVDADCRCGTEDLFTVLDSLSPDHHQAAVTAHIRNIREGYDHLLAAQACADGLGLATHLDHACLLCITDPEHVAHLDADVTHATSQLATVVSAFNATVVVGDRRAR